MGGRMSDMEKLLLLVLTALVCPFAIPLVTDESEDETMRNSEYTCDRCGTQVNKGEAYTLRLVKKMHTRELMTPVERTPYVEYDLCETCAAMVEERMKELTVTNLWERGAE